MWAKPLRSGLSMDDWDIGSNKVSGTLMGDTATNGQLIFLLLFILTLIMLALIPPEKKDAKAVEAEIKMPGNIMIWVRWPDYVDVDVDLWALAPGDKAVGYSNRAGKTFNLLRDDLGNTADGTKLNYEVMFGRDMPDGSYTVNVHLYRNGSSLVTVPVEVDVFISHGSRAESIAKKKVVLVRVGEEITIVNFTLHDGKIVGKSNDSYVPLRSSQVSGGAQ